MTAKAAPGHAAMVAKRHYLTILFTDLGDSTRLSTMMEPEQFTALLMELRRFLHETVERHGGIIVRIDGDGAICIFGFPDPQEDSGRRAVEAALDLHAGARLIKPAIGLDAEESRMHSGIHAGVVLVSEGDIVRGRYEILGEATNIAAHLCDLAGHGEILVSQAALGPYSGYFEAGPRRMVRPRGARQPMACLSVTGRSAAPSRFHAWAKRGIAPFAGRHSERNQLVSAASQLQESAPVAIRIVGEPGMGKSRLADQFASDLAGLGCKAHFANCDSSSGTAPLHPVRQLVRSLLAHEHGMTSIGSDMALVGWLNSFPDVERRALLSLCTDTDGIDEEGGHAAAFIRLADMHDGPLILCVEDWHSIDQASHDLFESALGLIKRPVMLVQTARPANTLFVHGCRNEVISLGPLEAAEVREAATAFLAMRNGHAPSVFEIDTIVERADGCPLHVEELCLSDQLDTQHQGSSGWLDALFQARFAALPGEVAAKVKIASVIGSSIPIALFEGVTGRRLDPVLIDQLAAADFILPASTGNSLRFKHALAREAIYRSVGLEERKRLHAEVVRWLGENDAGEHSLEVLAHHVLESGDHRKGAKLAVEAGKRALSLRALDRAQARFLDAFRGFKADGAARSPSVPLAAIVTGYGRACVIDPSRDQLDALSEMARLAERINDPNARVLALYWLGAILFGLGEARRSIAVMEQALPMALAQGRTSFAGQIRATIAESRFEGTCSPEIEAMLDAALDEMQAGLGEEALPAWLYALACRAQILADRGEFERADRDLERVERVLPNVHSPARSSLHTQIASIHIWKSDFPAALASAHAAQEAGRTDRSRQNRMIGQILAGFAGYRMTGEDRYANALVEATRWLEAASFRHHTGLYYGWCADVQARRGDDADARYWAALAFQRARGGDTLGLGNAARAMARLAAQGNAKRSAAHYLELAAKAADLRCSPREAEATQAAREEFLPTSTAPASLDLTMANR